MLDRKNALFEDLRPSVPRRTQNIFLTIKFVKLGQALVGFHQADFQAGHQDGFESGFQAVVGLQAGFQSSSEAGVLLFARESCGRSATCRP